MPRQKSPVPLPPHVKPEDLQRRQLQSNHETEHKNGAAKRTPYRPADDDDYNPNAGS